MRLKSELARTRAQHHLELHALASGSSSLSRPARVAAAAVPHARTKSNRWRHVALQARTSARPSSRHAVVLMAPVADERQPQPRGTRDVRQRSAVEVDRVGRPSRRLGQTTGGVAKPGSVIGRPCFGSRCRRTGQAEVAMAFAPGAAVVRSGNPQGARRSGCSDRGLRIGAPTAAYELLPECAVTSRRLHRQRLRHLGPLGAVSHPGSKRNQRLHLLTCRGHHRRRGRRI